MSAMSSLIWAGVLLFAYLLGSLSGSLMVGRLQGVDIRAQGSGNAGATNALRTRGWRFALATALIDVGKGVLAALLLPWLALRLGLSGADPLALALACVLAAAIGHCYPVWFGFRGGKGAGTLLGGLLCVLPLLAGLAFVVWLLVLFLTGYVGLATVLAGLSLPLMHAWFGGSGLPLALTCASALLILYMHRGNLQRVWNGTEYCFSKVRLLPGPKPPGS